MTFAGAATYTGSLYGWGNGTIWMDYVSCTGTETTLYNCGHQSPNNTYCSYNNLANVVCKSKLLYNYIMLLILYP